MTVTAFLSVAPATEESMAPAVAAAIEALEEFEIEYKTTPVGTVIEAEAAGEVFAAARAAHEAVPADRVGTTLKLDDKRTVDEPGRAKVDAVEAELDRPARSEPSLDG